MPAAYAHLTVVNILGSPNGQRGRVALPREAAIAIGSNLGYLELGSVSPDYPYLDRIPGHGSKHWADLMHYTRTGPLVVALAKEAAKLKGADWQKAAAWVFGYAAHVGADMTIHPVVELKVGEYAENSTAHRVCEMNQDVHVFERLDLGGIGLGEFLDQGIRQCGPDGRLDPVIRTVWETALRAIHPADFERNRPEIDAWHGGFCFALDAAEEGNRLWPFARHVAANRGLTYPEIADRKYIDRLLVPGNQFESYDQIFDRALLNVGSVWLKVASLLTGADQDEAYFGEWNLDTGRDDSGKLVMWEAA